MTTRRRLPLVNANRDGAIPRDMEQEIARDLYRWVMGRISVCGLVTDYTTGLTESNSQWNFRARVQGTGEIINMPVNETLAQQAVTAVQGSFLQPVSSSAGNRLAALLAQRHFTIREADAL